MYIPYIWRNVFCNPWKVIFLLNIVNDDVVRFVWELTERRWFYRYHYMRRYLMLFDRLGDIEYTVLFLMYCYHSFPHWEVCLCIYIILRLISFTVYSNTKLYKCYAVRTVLPTIISSFACCTAAWLPCIIAWNKDSLVILLICECLSRSIMYVVVLVQAYRKLWTLDLDVVFELKEDRWVYRYYGNRRFLIVYDRVFDIVVVGLFIFYHLKSIPYWPVSLVVCIFCRLISFALYSNTKIRKCYAIRTVLPTILSILCMIALWAPIILVWINETSVILPICLFLATCVSYVIVFAAVCNKYR